MYVKMGNSKPYTVNPSMAPGEIDNTGLLVPLSDFLNDGNTFDKKNTVLKSTLNQRIDLKIVHSSVWNLLVNFFKGGPPIPRGFLKERNGGFMKTFTVELFYRKLNVILLPERRKFSKDLIHHLKHFTIYTSRSNNLKGFKENFIQLLQKLEKNDNFVLADWPGLENWINKTKLATYNIKLWKISSSSTLADFKQFLFEKIDSIINSETAMSAEDKLSYLDYSEKVKLKDLQFADTDIGVIEYLDENSPAIFESFKIEAIEAKCHYCEERKVLTIFCKCKDVAWCGVDCKDRGEYFHESRCKRKFEAEDDGISENQNSRKGLTGLQNLGNTCFMNTSLQCMSNCYELTNYFLEDHYKPHINTENPIGTQGQLARAYANLLKNLWHGNSIVYSPWNFKSAIERFQSMFVGYSQHDTQEFLNYLLDGLHEDLNKVIKKPLVEKDDTQKDDDLKAAEQWIGFLRRNQSILVDLLYGQYKSTLHCPDPECQNISTTFDPFLSISLPLVSNKEQYEVTCFFIFYDMTILPIQIVLSFFAETSVMSLRNKLAKLLDINPWEFIVAKMDKSGDLDYLMNSNMLVHQNSSRLLHKNQQSFFCFQIKPECFYSSVNNRKLAEGTVIPEFSQIFDVITEHQKEKLNLYNEDYEEDESGQTKDELCYYSKFAINLNGTNKNVQVRVNTDENNGLNQDWMKVILNMRKYEDARPDLKRRLIFPRVIYVNKSWSTKKLHQVICAYFSVVLKKKYSLKDNDIWDTFFPDLHEVIQNSQDLTFDEHRRKAFPYLIHIKNIFTEMGSSCIFCMRKDCDDCLLPCSDEITIQDILDKIPQNQGMAIDNSFYYMQESQRHRYGIRERDFVLGITWLRDYEGLVRDLNEKKDFVLESKKGRYEDSIDINNCFKNFVKLEKLQEGNEWYCSQCKKHQRAEKKMEIYKTPHILIIHLKRFRNNSKLDTLVDFPINGLDISNYVMYKEKDVPMVYDLFAIANHYGSLFGGHYVAYGKNYISNRWYSFNDSSVSSIEENQLITSSAYVLLYRRRNLNTYVNLPSLYIKPLENYENEDKEASAKSIKNNLKKMDISDI